MGERRLENAAAAAGYAMVNPDDFAHEAAPFIRQNEEKAAASTGSPQMTTTDAKSWFNWDYLRLTGNKATA